MAVRRVDLAKPQDQALFEYLRERKFTLLPNTAGCYTADDAIRTCRLAREAGMTDFVKLEVLGDPATLFPDVEQTLEAARVLVKEGFTVLPYTNDDPITCKKLEDIGCAAVMPLGAPIGSGLGIRNPYNIEIILKQSKVPVIVDAGVGTASDAAIAMELGCHGVLMNTAIAGAKDPVRMARAMRLAVEAGRLAYLCGAHPQEALRHGLEPARRRDRIGESMKSAVLALCAALLAPYQCATSKNERPLEDTAPKALWILSERFQKDGDDKARETTLRQIVEQYPGSRYASRARSELGMPEARGRRGRERHERCREGRSRRGRRLRGMRAGRAHAVL